MLGTTLQKVVTLSTSFRPPLRQGGLSETLKKTVAVHSKWKRKFKQSESSISYSSCETDLNILQLASDNLRSLQKCFYSGLLSFNCVSILTKFKANCCPKKDEISPNLIDDLVRVDQQVLFGVAKTTPTTLRNNTDPWLATFNINKTLLCSDWL